MRRSLQAAIVLLGLSLTAISVRAGERVDGIAATVNDVAILHSDLDVAMRCEALMEGRPLESVTAEQRRAVLDRLIDQELLRQQMGVSFVPPKPEELRARIQQVRQQLGYEKNEDGWRALLVRYGLAPGELEARIGAQMQLTGFLESRLQSVARVDPAAVAKYYREKLLPELRKRGVQGEPPVAEYAGQIEEILRQERLTELLAIWLQRMRQQARIRTATEPAPPVSAESSWRSMTVLEAPGK